MVHIHLIAVKVGPGKWVITTTDMAWKYEIPRKPCDCVLCRLKVEKEKTLREFYGLES